jgi:DNA repair protein SbcC/Rad50
MRILKVRLKNLNSLVGEWEIDFTHPSFTSDGLFAITGATGSGKTTILDAICLALYGRTPRLERVNKSSNEVMSRQTGECYAEVIFQNQKGQYLCHWGQQRSHKKVDGNLQNPKHEIAEAVSGKIVETYLSKVPAKVEELTGMDFSRFTRSMLLAQGGFAAFLEATSDERAPILEQITGTEIYSLISIAAHERRVDERKKMDVIQAELSGMQLLSSEDEQKFTSQYEENKKWAISIESKIKKKNAALGWLETIEKLSQEIIAFTGKQGKLDSRIAVFQPDAKRLEKAKQALELSAGYATLIIRRKTQHDDKTSLVDLHASFQKVKNVSGKRKEQETDAHKDVRRKKSEQKDGLQTILKVRELDVKYKGKAEGVKETENGLAELESAFKAVVNQKNSSGSELKKAHKELQKIEGFLGKNGVYEKLVSEFSLIAERFDVCKKAGEKVDAHTNAINEAGEHIKGSGEEWEKEKQVVDGFQEAFHDKQKLVENCRENLQTKLDGKEIGGWRKELSGLKERKTLLTQIATTLKGSIEIEETLASLIENRKILCLREEALAEDELEKKNSLDFLENELQNLETQLTLLNRIKDLEDARHTLEDGKVCPLCGSQEHPFAIGNVPKPDEAENTIREKRKALKELNKALTAIVSAKAKVHKEKELQSKSHLKQEQQLKILQQRLSQEKALAGIEVLKTDDPLRTLQDILKEAEGRCVVTENLVEEVELMEKGFVLQEKALDVIKDELVRAEKRLQKVAYKRDSAENELKRLQREQRVLKKQEASYLEDTLRILKPYGVKSLPLGKAEQILTKLRGQRDQWQGFSDRKIELDKNIIHAKSLEKQLLGHIVKLEQEINDKNSILAERTKECDILLEERRKLFQDKNPNDEEAKLSEAVEDGEKHLEAARKASNASQQDIINKKSRIETVEHSVKVRSKVLQGEEASFVSVLAKSKFQDEEDFKNACLDESERKALETQEKVLLTDKAEIESALKDRKIRMETEKKKQLTDQQGDLLKSEIVALTKELAGLQQEIGSIRQKLEENIKLRSRMEDRVKAMESQKKECDRWDLLHSLIGSADGKKYRNFAQGLTFEMMVAHANLQLQKMTDRYLLIRDHSSPLELSVVDNYQGGEMRTTKNLSGGESFIVSLSLALGLSSMASKNVRVDSLFLDEGFGSLDEEALDMALDTLASLHQDGKLIGVISHVQTMKERISTQIQVTSLTGGRSGISGPGCVAVAR